MTEPKSKKAKYLPSDGKGKRQRYRNFCFTSYDLNVGEYFSVCDLPPSIKYLVYQQEVCPETKRDHIQGYCELTKQLTLEDVKVLFNDLALHVEQRKGTAAQAADYCKKDNTYKPGGLRVERGTISNPGRRTDLEALAATVVAGGQAAITEIARNHPGQYVRVHRGLEALAARVSPPTYRGRPYLLYMFGSPGCGKSRLAHDVYPNAYCATDKKEGWFDGYRGEECIIFDDFEGNFPLREMLKLCDYYSLQLAVKGAFAPIRATKIIFTSNHDPLTLYDGPAGEGSAWARRLRDFGTIWREDKIRELCAQRFPDEPAAASALDIFDNDFGVTALGDTQEL